MKQPDLKIYTDGSCSPNPGPGGWAAILLFENSGKVIELKGAEKQTTNNRMELLAAIKALQSLQEKCAIEVLTDSKYLQKGVTEWISRWKNNNWKTSEGFRVKNRDLWEQFAEQLGHHTVSWTWVKGHDVDRWNNRADELAVAARKSLDISGLDELQVGVHFYLGVTWKNSTGYGAWSNILKYRNRLKVIGGFSPKTTANQLYLISVIEGIKTLKRTLPVYIHTRSGYLRDGMEVWMDGWRRRGWKTREGADVSNRDLWQELEIIKRDFKIKIQSVPPEDPPCHTQEAKQIAREFEQLHSTQ